MERPLEMLTTSSKGPIHVFRREPDRSRLVAQRESTPVHDLATILAPPPRPGKSKTAHPFAALPHALRKDPRLKGNNLAIVLAAALLEYCRDRPSCYPTNARLAADMGCSESTARAALADLKATGWARVVIGPRQPNGRR